MHSWERVKVQLLKRNPPPRPPRTQRRRAVPRENHRGSENKGHTAAASEVAGGAGRGRQTAVVAVHPVHSPLLGSARERLGRGAKPVVKGQRPRRVPLEWGGVKLERRSLCVSNFTPVILPCNFRSTLRSFSSSFKRV